MRRVLAAVLALLFLSSIGAFASGSPLQVDSSQEFSRVKFIVSVDSDGDARWTFHYERPLENETEREEFRAFAGTFNAEETAFVTQFREQATRLTAAGENATGREMSAVAFDRDARVTGLNDNLGVAELSFTWTGFGVVEGDRVVVRDVFEGGLYVGNGQALVFETGTGVSFVSATPDPDSTSGASLTASDSVTYRGEREFSDNRPWIEFTSNDTLSGGSGDGGDVTTTQSGDGGDTTATQSGDVTSPGGDDETPSGGDEGQSWLPWAAAVFVAVLIGVGFAWRAGVFESSDSSSRPSTRSSALSISDEELKSDEERVIDLLEAQGGRVRQSMIVDETEWSKSKVSMLLSDMARDGQLSKLRVGRENIVSLPGREPDATRSALDTDDGNDE